MRFVPVARPATVAGRILTGRLLAVGEAPWPMPRPGEAPGTPPGPNQAVNRLGSLSISLCLSLQFSLSLSYLAAGLGEELMEEEGRSPPPFIAARGGLSLPCTTCEGGASAPPSLTGCGKVAAAVKNGGGRGRRPPSSVNNGGSSPREDPPKEQGITYRYPLQLRDHPARWLPGHEPHPLLPPPPALLEQRQQIETLRAKSDGRHSVSLAPPPPSPFRPRPPPTARPPTSRSAIS